MNLNFGILDYIYNGARPTTPYVLCLVATLAVAYLLGSINSAIIVSKTLHGEDIRTKGSGNAGLTNTLRTYGKGAAGLVLLGDMLKTVISIFIAGLVFGFYYSKGISFSTECYLAGLFSIIGHVFPVYYKFKGGKGVLSTSTMALMLTPIHFGVLLLIFIGVVAVSKYVSLGSVIVAVLYPIILDGTFKITSTPEAPVTCLGATIASILLAVLIVYCHRGNLQRISDHTERKLSFGRKKNDDEE